MNCLSRRWPIAAVVNILSRKVFEIGYLTSHQELYRGQQDKLFLIYLFMLEYMIFRSLLTIEVYVSYANIPARVNILIRLRP